MKVPISNRLLLCAEFVPRGTRAADIGTDHGYLAVHLLREGVCPFVTAADLREQPLQKARENAARFGVSENMQFFLSDGLQSIPPGAADTIIMAGMGGDLMVRILGRAVGLRRALYAHSAAAERRAGAAAVSGRARLFAIEREALAKDGHFSLHRSAREEGEHAPAFAGTAIRLAAAAAGGRAASGPIPGPNRDGSCRHSTGAAKGR